MVSTKVVLLMPEMRQLVIKDTVCPYVAMVTGTLLALEKLLLYVEGFKYIFLFFLGLTLPKHIENMVVTHQSV